MENKEKVVLPAIGPYSAARWYGEILYVSGQIPLDPKTNELVPGGIVEQTTQTLSNLKAVLDWAQLKPKDVVRCEIFLSDIQDYGQVNELYAGFFSEQPYPARQAVAVSGLPKGALIEISCIASKPST